MAPTGASAASRRTTAPMRPAMTKISLMTLFSHMRTDLDAFSAAEQAVLENHGYLLAEVAAATHLSAGLIEPDAPVGKAPHEEWLRDAEVRQALADSHKRRLLGRW